MHKYWPLAAAFLIALALRLVPADTVFEGGRVYFFEGDCYKHMRQIMLHVQAFPGFVGRDFYEGYPVGTPVITPPLIDWLVSAVSVALSFGNPSTRLVETVAALAPPVVGAATTVAAYLFARMAFGHGVGLGAAFIIALMPANIVFTLVGRIDNEMVEPLVVGLLFASFMRLQRGASTWNAMLTAMMSFATLMFWRGATLWIMLVAAGMAVDVTLDYMRGSAPGRHRHYALSMFAFAALVGLFCVFNVWGTQRAFSFNIISWFHVAVFMAASACIYLYGALCGYWLGLGWRRIGLLGALLGAMGAIVLLCVAVPPLRENLSAGIGMLGLGSVNPWIESISEYKPLLSNGNIAPAKMFGWIFWLSPVFALWMLADEVRRSEPRREVVFHLVAFCAVLALTLLRTRFAGILALSVSAIGAWALWRVFGLFGRKAIAVPVVMALAAFMFYPYAQSANELRRVNVGYTLKGPLDEAVLWMRDHTPEAGELYSTGVKPSYGVMAQWDQGGWIKYLGQRPAVATLYGSETFGLTESARFYLEKDEARASALLESIGVRYVFAQDYSSYMALLSAVLDGRDRRFFSSMGDSNVPTREFLDLVSTRLYLGDGAPLGPPLRLEPLERFRLVFESTGAGGPKWMPGPMSAVKIFEFVKGARLSVSAAPGARVTVSARVATNGFRLFLFSLSKTADSMGRAEFTLPYAPQSGVGLIGTYTITDGNVSRELGVAESDVLNGAPKEVSLVH